MSQPETASALEHSPPAAGWVKPAGWILAAALVTFFTGLGVPALFDQDEGYFAGTALEMHRRGDWIVPTFNGELFGHKPPLMFWMMRFGYLLFGENELGARFFSAVAGSLTALVTFLIGRRVFTSQQAAPITHSPAFWSGLAMTSCLMFGVVSRAATPDAYLVLSIGLALWAYVRSVPQVWNSEMPTAHLGALLPGTWRDWLMLYGAMGIAVLVKGPIGVLLPGCTIGLFVILMRFRQRPLTASKGWIHNGISVPWRVFCRMHPALAIAVVLLVAGPWFALVGWKTNGQFLSEFFGTHNVGRFLHPMENHRGPIWYYIPITLVGFFPWSVFSIPVTLDVIRRLRRPELFSPAHLFLACWAGVMMGFFSVASTKLPSYVLPAYPALALLTGAWVADWVQGRESIWPRWPVVSWSIFAFVGAGILIAVPLLGLNFGGETLAHRVNLNEGVLAETLPLMSIGLIPLGFGAFAIWQLNRSQRTQAITSFTVGATAFSVALLAGGASRVDQHQFTAEMTQLAEQRSESGQVAAFCYFQPSMVFYSHAPVRKLGSIQDAETVLRQPGEIILLTSAGLEALQQESRIPVEIVETRPSFPKPGELLLIRARKVPAAPAEQAILPVNYEVVPDRPQ